jgi:putative membrane protein
MKIFNLFMPMYIVSLFSVFTLLSRDEALAQSGRYSDWHMGPGMMGSWGMGEFGMIFMVALWVLAIVGLIFLLKWLMQTAIGKKEGTHGNSLQAVDILKERYARGEIDQAEFETKKRDLGI